jgi:hypothetical protein
MESPIDSFKAFTACPMKLKAMRKHAVFDVSLSQISEDPFKVSVSGPSIFSAASNMRNQLNCVNQVARNLELFNGTTFFCASNLVRGSSSKSVSVRKGNDALALRIKTESILPTANK